MAIIAVLLALGLLVFWFVRDSGDEGSEAADCVRYTLRVAVAPGFKDLADQAIGVVDDGEPCIDFEVQEATVKQVLAGFSDYEAEQPQLWIPDTPAWRSETSTTGYSVTELVPALAKSPVGIASGPMVRNDASWREALDGEVVLGDPVLDGGSALAILASRAERGTTGITDEQQREFVAKLAGDYAVRAVTVGVEEEYDLSTVNQHSTQVVPMTEQAYLQRSGSTQAQLWAPRTGTPVLDFPLLQVARSGEKVPAVVGRGARAIQHWFTSKAGREAVNAAFLRNPDSAPLEGTGLGEVRALPTVRPEKTRAAFADWSIAAIPSSVLTVYDLSASMREDLGGESRIDVAVNAGLLSLDVLPGYTKIGLWSFSSTRDDSPAWTELAPIRRIDERVGDGTHSDKLRSTSLGMPDKVRGGTKLFNTVESAYKKAIEEYDPVYNNSVVVFTDGGADDTSTIDLPELVNRLKELRDPERPVHFVMIGISDEADSAVLRSIAQATRGSSFVVSKPEDMVPVLASALLG